MSYILSLLIYASLGTTIILALESDPRKLVCAQIDGTTEAPKGYCFRLNGSCSCTEDCTESLSIAGCVCTRADLAFAQDQKLANCTIWKQKTWFDYVTSSRRNSTNVDLPPPASNTPDGKGLWFSTSDENLAWPITDGRDMGNLLIHGPHCLQMIEMFNKQILNGQPLDNVYDRLHSEHCRRLARRVLNYYQNKERNYQVRPASLCSDLHTLYYTTSPLSDHHRARRQLSADELVAGSNENKEKYGRQLAEDELMAGSNENKEKYGRELPAQTYAAGYDDDGLLYPLRYGKSVLHNSDQSRIAAVARSIYAEMYANAEIGSRKPSQQSMFNTISGQNLGNLLLKEWLELPLTNSERHFFAAWESELVVRTAALGMYCIQGKAKHAPITGIRDLLLMKVK